MGCLKNWGLCVKLTCVTATFNCIKAGNRERLVRCVESVAKLKTEHEHLIYDGASTDGTVELLRELEAKTPGLRVVSEPDAGIYNALNKGVRDAKGEWFYVLGADDYIVRPDVMDALVAEYDCDEIITPVERERGMRGIADKMIFIATPYCHQGTIQKTSAIRRFGGFDERYKIAADFDLVLKFHKTALDIRIDKRIFAFFGGGGVSSVELDKMNAEFDKISAEHFNSSLVRVSRMRQLWRVSFGMAFPYIFHKDYMIRRAARLEIYDRIKGILRIPLYPIVIARRMVRNHLTKPPRRA